MDASFLVDGDPPRTGLGERRDEIVRMFNHQMTIERDLGDLAERCDDRWSNRNVGDEMAIHDVHVKEACPAVHGGLCFGA